MEASHLDLLDKIDKGKQEFLDFIEYHDYHLTDEDIYEFFIGLDENDVMEFVSLWDYNMETFEATVYQFANCLDEKEKALPQRTELRNTHHSNYTNNSFSFQL